jgi:5-methylcytosine-specific restriction endonuclease McrA
MVEYVAHTPRSKMTKARAVRIFLARNGICVTCGQQIRPGQGWFIEHPESLALGGSDNEADLWPAHRKCKASKDAADAAEKARRDRIVASGWADKPKTKWGSRGFQRAQPQRSATREIRRKSEAQGEAK